MTDLLFQPLRVGAIDVANRIFMAPMTRLRSADPGDTPTPLMAAYYAQRATAGLIITEATDISSEARGYAGAPGVHTTAQVDAWKDVADGIHAQGGKCAMQLWHTGRNSHVSLQPGGAAPVAPSAIHSHSRTSLKDEHGQVVRVETSQPRELRRDELPRIVDDFRQAALNARKAGFDLVEIHAAHGYLLHQFLSPDSNHRTDEFGGSIENRARFPLSVVDAVCGALSPDRVGVRLFPSGTFKGLLSTMGEQDTSYDTRRDYLYLIGELARRDLAYLHLSEPDWTGGEPMTQDYREAIRQRYAGVIVGAGSYTREKAAPLLDAKLIDAVAFGRPFLANPDLVARFRQHAPLNTADKDTFYGGGAKGYTDYPTLEP